MVEDTILVACIQPCIIACPNSFIFQSSLYVIRLDYWLIKQVPVRLIRTLVFVTSLGHYLPHWLESRNPTKKNGTGNWKKLWSSATTGTNLVS